MRILKTIAVALLISVSLLSYTAYAETKRQLVGEYEVVTNDNDRVVVVKRADGLEVQGTTQNGKTVIDKITLPNGNLVEPQYNAEMQLFGFKVNGRLVEIKLLAFNKTTYTLRMLENGRYKVKQLSFAASGITDLMKNEFISSVERVSSGDVQRKDLVDPDVIRTDDGTCLGLALGGTSCNSPFGDLFNNGFGPEECAAEETVCTLNCQYNYNSDMNSCNGIRDGIIFGSTVAGAIGGGAAGASAAGVGSLPGAAAGATVGQAFGQGVGALFNYFCANSANNENAQCMGRCAIRRAGCR